jgi:hypothetical protein
LRNLISIVQEVPDKLQDQMVPKINQLGTFRCCQTHFFSITVVGITADRNCFKAVLGSNFRKLEVTLMVAFVSD